MHAHASPLRFCPDLSAPEMGDPKCRNAGRRRHGKGRALSAANGAHAPVDRRAASYIHILGRSRNRYARPGARTLPRLVVDVDSGNADDPIIRGRIDNETDAISGSGHDNQPCFNGNAYRRRDGARVDPSQTHRDDVGLDFYGMQNCSCYRCTVEDLDVRCAAYRYEARRWRGAHHPAARATYDDAASRGAVTGIGERRIERVGRVSVPADDVGSEIKPKCLDIEVRMSSHAGIRLSDDDTLAFLCRDRPCLWRSHRLD